MAIKSRRGNYADLDTTKLVGGEIAITDSPSRLVVKTAGGDVFELSENGGGGSGDAYKTIKVGSTNIVASGEDTIELVAGSNVSLTPDTTNKRVTISSSGGGGGSVTVEDNLVSTSAVNALSANQGRVLKGLVDGVDTEVTAIQNVIPSGATTSNKLATASDIPDTSTLQPKNLSTTIGSYTTVEGALSGINDGKVDKVTGKGLSTNDYSNADKAIVDSVDSWTATATVDSSKTVTFTGLNDNYGYSLYCQNKLAIIKSMTKTGSGTSVQVVYTLDGVSQGDVCKLRIAK